MMLTQATSTMCQTPNYVESLGASEIHLRKSDLLFYTQLS